MNKSLSQLRGSQDIYIRLEQYDDIFSDFDMRPYGSRALSIDFLDEMKRAVSETSGAGIELMLHVPEKERNESYEATIHDRLVAHFHRHYLLLLKEKRHVLKLGITMVGLGIIFMIVATLIIFKDPSKNLLLSFFAVFLDPAAVFLLWEGMDQIIFQSKNVNPELDFYKKMSHAQGRVYFKSY